MESETVAANGKRINWPQTKSGGVVRDSLEKVAFRQTHPELRIMSYIQYKDGVYSLALTQEEAETLGFTEDLFQKYVSYVETLNNSSTNKE